MTYRELIAGYINRESWTMAQKKQSGSGDRKTGCDQ